MFNKKIDKLNNNSAENTVENAPDKCLSHNYDTAKVVDLIAKTWGSIMKPGYPSKPGDYFGTFMDDVRAPELNEIHTKNTKVYPNRISMLHSIPKGGIMAEIGTLYGKFAEQIHQICKPKELHIIDIEFRKEFTNYFDPYIEKGEVILHKGDSSSILSSKFPDKHFDFIYIDGDHSYEGVNKDLLAAVKKIKDTGLIGLNDYCIIDILTLEKFGIKRAVNEVCLNLNFEITGFAFQKHGFHDVVIKKLQ